MIIFLLAYIELQIKLLRTWFVKQIYYTKPLKLKIKRAENTPFLISNIYSFEPKIYCYNKVPCYTYSKLLAFRVDVVVPCVVRRIWWKLVSITLYVYVVVLAYKQILFWLLKNPQWRGKIQNLWEKVVLRSKINC